MKFGVMFKLLLWMFLFSLNEVTYNYIFTLVDNWLSHGNQNSEKFQRSLILIFLGIDERRIDFTDGQTILGFKSSQVRTT